MKDQHPFRGRSKTVREFQRDRKKQKIRKAASRKRKPKNPKIVEATENTAPSKVWESFQRGLKWGVGLGLLLLAIYALAYSPLFRINAIRVTGVQESVNKAAITATIEERLEGTTWGIIPNNNALLLREKDIEMHVQEKHAIVQTVSTTIRLPRAIDVQIVEKKREVIIEQHGRHVDVDSHGTAFQETPPNDLADILQSEQSKTNIVHVTSSNDQLTIGDRITEESFIAFASQLPDIMKHFTRLEIERISTPGLHTRELHVETAEGWLLLLDTARSPQNEIKTLNKVVEEKIGPEELDNIEYIDLRIREKTFYKLKK